MPPSNTNQTPSDEAAPAEAATSPRKLRKWFNREIFGWAMFDFANQSFTLVILTTMFQLYFVNYIVENDDQLGRQLWATSGVIGQVIVIAISPLIGALADFSGAKKRLLFATYVMSVLLTASLGLITPGQTALGMTLFIVGYIFYATGENFMGSFLPELAKHRDMGKVSGFGWSMGYVGGLLCLGGAAAITAIVEDQVAAFRWICVWAGVFFMLAGIPTFVLLRERKLAEDMPPDHTMLTIGFVRIAETFRSLSRFKQLFRYLGIMTFYLSGMQIVIWFAGTIARDLFHLSEAQLAIYIVVLTVMALVGAVLTLTIQDRIGTRTTILLALGIWLPVMAAAGFASPERQWLFWVLGTGIGLGIGMLGTSSRSMVGLFSPHHKAAEFFGFYGLGHKFAAIIGLGWTILAEMIFSQDQYNLVVASSAMFFIVGIGLMFTVNEKEGRIVAMKASRAHERKFRDYREG